MTIALAEASIAVAAGLAAIARGGRFLWWVWRHRHEFPPNHPRSTR